MTEKVKKHLWSWKPILAFKQTGKKALALLLSAALVITTMPVIQMPVSAEETADAAVQDSGYIAGKDGFHVVAYDKSARIEIPFVSGAKNYKVYLSQAEGLTDFSGASCVLNSDTYQSYAYAVNGNKDAANDSKTISIGYSDGGDNTYDFYLVTNDGSADTVQDSVEVKTRSTADATWTTPGHYDTGWYGDGSASEFTIKTAAQLAGLAVLTDGLNDETATDFTGKTIHLASSVDLSEYLWTPIGTETHPFNATFDGGNYDKDGTYTIQNVVSGLHTNDNSQPHQGLLGYADSLSAMQNIGVVSSNANGQIGVGGIAGLSYGTITNCYNTGTVSGSGDVGGIAGGATNLTNCYNTGTISGSGEGVGGVAGEAINLTNCYNTGTVSGTGDYVGGIVGLFTGNITSCYNTNTVSGTGDYVGGIAGLSYGTITNCYNTGTISGSDLYVGGVAGGNGGIVAICYNTGVVSGTQNVGGIVGASSGNITSCYNTNAVSGTGDYVGGISGATDDNDTTITYTNCYNTGAVSGTGEHVGGVAGSSSGTIKSAYSAGKVNGADTYITYNASGTADSSATNQSELTGKIDTGSTSAFVAAPTTYAHYHSNTKETGVLTSKNPLNKGYPVLRSFGYTDNTDANGFSPATITVEDGTVTVGTDYGDGTESKPYIIRNAYQMDLVRSYTQTKDVYFKLAGNVDISPAQYNKTPDENGCWTSSDSWKPIGAYNDGDSFKGNLDGNHCTISGMFISNATEGDYQGLFAYTLGSTIHDLGTAASIMTANGVNYTYFGSIAGIGSGTIKNCYNAGTVSSYDSPRVCQLGGIVGCAYGFDSTTFENCYNSGTVIGNGYNAIVGGVVGYSKTDSAYQSTLSCCYNSGAVTGSSPENSGTTGGVAGLWYGSLTNSYNAGKVSSSGYGGGVAGRAIAASDTNNIVSNCYNLATVSETGTSTNAGCIGGVFGTCGGSSYSNVTGLVSNCYNTGTVYGKDNEAGGVAGGISYATVQNCYNTGKVTGILYTGGIAGSFDGNAESCYNTGAIDTGSGSTESVTHNADFTGDVGGLVGLFTGEMKNCYNTAVISSNLNSVGGLAGNVAGDDTVITACYNTGNLNLGKDAQGAGGLVGYLTNGSISLCYNLGTISGGYWSIGGIAGNLNGKTAVSKCYFSGCRTGIGFGGFSLGDGAATPFVSCASSLAVGKTADISEVAYDKLDSDFKAAFGMTAVRYPDGYESSDTDVLTVKDKTVTAVKAGNAAVNGTAGEHSNAKIVISQNALNMTDATSGFKDAGTDVVSGAISLPVTVAANPKFTAFSVATSGGTSYTGKIDDSKNTILIKVPDGTDVSSLVATFTVNTGSVYANNTYQESGTTANDFSNSVKYTIYGMSNRDYTVMVVPASESLAGMDDYSIKIGDSDYAGTIDEDKKTISVTVPYGTNLTKLVADFSASNGSDVTVGEAAQESGTTENDFSSPVSYKVTGLDKSTETYTVKVTCADKSEKSLSHFKLSEGDDTYQGIIDQKNHTITVTVSEDSDISSLIAAFDTLAPNVKVGDKEQKSGTTANDFTNTVTYTVTAADGSTQDYKVTVTVEGESSCGFKSFSLTDKDDNTYTGTIDKEKHTIAVTVPSGTDVTELTAKFEATADATVTVEKSKQESGTTKNDFTDSVTYTVKAKDGTTQDYKVTVKVASGAEFQSYSLKEKDGSDYYTGTIDKDNHTIQVKVPYGTDVTQLIAKFATVEDAPVTIGTTVQDSNHTENDFTNTVTYIVKAADGSTQEYKVTVTVAGETSFQSYSLTDEDGNTYDGMINDAKGTIAVTVPKGTNVKKLTAEFTTSAAVTVEVKGTEQVSGETVNDFTNPVTYTVTAKSGSTQNYKVTVTIHSDHKDDDDKESSHHHNHSSDSSPKPKKPKTKTTVDSEKNTASVAAVASDVTQNGNVAEIQVLVPTITSDSSNGKTALDLSKDAAVTIELPKNDIIQQINAGKSANVSLTLPSEAKNDGSLNLAVSIPIAKEILEAAKEGTKDLTLKVQYADQQQASYTWAFKGEDLAKSGTPLSDVDMQTSILPAAKVSAVNRLTNGVQGLVVEFAQDGALPAPAAIGFSAQDQGLAANQRMDVYQLDSLSGQLIPTGKKVAVDAFGNTNLSVDSCHEYVLLPDSIRTITLDTRVYTMNVGDSYETGVTLLNAPAGARLKAYSSTDGVIAATVLPNGDVKAIGLKPGLTYAMIDVYDSKNHFLTHASVRIIIKGTDHPYGNSFRQFGIY